MRTAALSLLLGLVLISTGCENQREVDNFGGMGLLQAPQVTSSGRFGLDLADCQTFSVLPLGQEGPYALGEQKLAWILRGALESYGYAYRQDLHDADLVVALFATTSYATSYVPPQSIVVPMWVPGQTTYGQLTTISPWGTSQTYGTVTSPGRWTVGTATRPGHTVGAYYPYVGVTVCRTEDFLSANRASDAISWQGSAAGITNDPGLEMPGQALLLTVLAQARALLEARPHSPIGCRVFPLSPDGQTTFAAVLRVYDGTPAARAGIRAQDIIESINGQSTANKDEATITQMLSKPPLSLAVLRSRGRQRVAIAIDNAPER